MAEHRTICLCILAQWFFSTFSISGSARPGRRRCVLRHAWDQLIRTDIQRRPPVRAACWIIEAVWRRTESTSAAARPVRNSLARFFSRIVGVACMSCTRQTLRAHRAASSDDDMLRIESRRWCQRSVFTAWFSDESTCFPVTESESPNRMRELSCSKAVSLKSAK